MRGSILRALAKKGRLEVLEHLTDYPKREFTINELSRETGIAVMTAQRAVKDLENLDLVRVKSIGNAFAVSINEDSGLLKSVRSLNVADPHLLAAQRFARRLKAIGAAKACYLFGSVAAGRHSPASDVDIAVVYRGRTDGIRKQVAGIVGQERSHMRITPLLLSETEFEKRRKKNDQLVQNILKGELLWKR